MCLLRSTVMSLRLDPLPHFPPEERRTPSAPVRPQQIRLLPLRSASTVSPVLIGRDTSNLAFSFVKRREQLTNGREGFRSHHERRSKRAPNEAKILFLNLLNLLTEAIRWPLSLTDNTNSFYIIIKWKRRTKQTLKIHIIGSHDN